MTDEEKTTEISSNISNLLDSMEQAPNTDLVDSVARERARTKIIWVAIVALIILLQVGTIAASLVIARQVSETQTAQTAYEARQALNTAALAALQEANTKLVEQGKEPIPIPDSGDPLNADDITKAAAELVIDQLPNVDQETVIGPVGPVGPSGPPGAPGTNGLDGLPGMSIIGPPGEPGVPGNDGLDGLDGTNGLSGQPGPRGVTGDKGANGVGIASAVIQNCSLLLTFSNGVVVDLGNVCGANGTNGTDGAPGAVGPQGEVGPTGPEGPEGPQGPQGDPGDTIIVTTTVTAPPS